MIERIASGFHPFVLPFLFGMLFVLTYCFWGIVRILWELSWEERRKFFLSLINPKTILKNIKDIFLNCLIHVKLWKKNKLLGFMHSSIAFGWFMLIVLGHLEVMIYLPDRLKAFYYPIFFNFFVAENDATIKGKVFFFLMDFFLALVLCGIALAMYKRVRSRIFGMRRTTRPSFLDLIGLYSLWAIFPLRLVAEGLTAHISGGSFLTIPLNWLFQWILGKDVSGALPDLGLPIWWAYSITLGVFMTVLPFTRYMHIPAEMMLIPMRNAGLKVEHARRGFAKVMVYSCPGCGVCIDACPMSVKRANTKDTTVYLNRQIRRRNERRIEEISDKCLLCGKCSQVCQIGIDAPAIRVAQRAHRKYGISQDFSGVEVGFCGVPQGGGGVSVEGALCTADFRHSDAERQRSEESRPPRVLYFAGCMTQLTPRIIKAMESVLHKAGVDYQFLDWDGGLCCGRPLMMAGRFEEAKQLVEKNREAILASGCDTLLLSCPICYKIFREQYHLEGIRVVHHTEFFNELVTSAYVEGVSRHSEGAIATEESRQTLDPSGFATQDDVGGHVTDVPLFYAEETSRHSDAERQRSEESRHPTDVTVYHDPCELGRGCGVYDAPRELLSKVGHLVEAGNHHAASICCGGSIGSLTLTFEGRKDLTLNALKDLSVNNPTQIATACPLCLATFSRYSQIPVRDIAEIVDEAI